MTERLDKTLEKVYKKYEFLFSEKKDYYDLVKQIIVKYSEIDLDEISLKNLVTELELVLINYLKEMMKSNAFKVINQYVNINFKDERDYLKILEEIADLGWISQYRIDSEMMKRLLKGNAILRHAVGEIAADNKYYLKNGRLEVKINNELISEFVYVYCDLEKINNDDVGFQEKYPYYGYGLPKFKTLEEERAVLKRAQSGEKKAASEMCFRNFGLVYFVAKKYMIDGFDINDLVQEGLEGILLAIKKYDFKYNIKFADYAYNFVRTKIYRFVITKGYYTWGVYNNYKLLNDYQKVFEKLSNELNRIPSLQEIARELNVSTEKLQIVLITQSDEISLDEPLKEDGSETLAYTLADEDIDISSAYEAKAFDKDVIDILEKSTLKEREKLVLKLRFGLDGTGRVKSRTEIGEILGVSRQAIEQNEANALKKLKNNEDFVNYFDLDFEDDTDEMLKDKVGLKRKKQKR